MQNGFLCASSPRILILACIAATGLQAADWPQYRGPNHDGVSVETIRANWSAQAPRQVWKVPLGPALSSISVSGGRAFTQARRNTASGDREFCVALNADTGQELWSVSLDIADYPNGGVGDDDGPRSTPSVDGNRVFVLSSYLRLSCLDAATGREIWSKDLKTEYGANVIAWQNAASPLIVNDLVLVNCNGRPNEHLLAFRKQDGSLAWKGHSDGMTQSSPVAATIGGVRQVIFFAQSGLVSVAPDTGAALWRHSLRYNGTSVAASPVVAGDMVYCSRAYPGSLSAAQAGAVVVQLSASGGSFSANPVWSKVNQLMNHWATPVHYSGHLYGMFGQDFLQFKCVEAATGVEKWAADGFGYGSALVVGGKILAASSDGWLVLVDPNPSAYTEITRYRALQGKTWNVPSISGGRIYFRSTTEAVCLDVAPEAPPPPPRVSPQITWATPAAISYGTALSRAQLNASANVPGTFVYAPASGAVLSAGNQTLSVTFTPNDTANYQDANAAVTLNVLKAHQTITFNPLNDRRLTDAPLTLDATASSALPVSFSVSGPATLSGRTLTPNGRGTVTVTATQAGDANYNAAASVQRQFAVIANTAPIFESIAARTIDEGSALSFLIRATDADGPAQTLIYRLTGDVPTGARIDSSTGAFAWTPTEAQGPATYNFTVQVSDNGDPIETSSRSFSVTVNEVNTAPALAMIPNQTVRAGQTLTFTTSASDADLPANALTFSLGPGAPATATLHAVTGLFSWTPPRSLETKTNVVSVEVADNGFPSLKVSQTFTLLVTPSNLAPVFQPPPMQTIAEGNQLMLTLAAVDPDTPPNQVFFALGPDAPAGANLDPALGQFSWTPTEAQGPSTNVITVRILDDGTPNQSFSTNFTVIVTEVNAPPNLGDIPDQTVPLGGTVTFKMDVSDSDLPVQKLAFALDAGAPDGASIGADTGVFTWTPTSTQAPSTNHITVRVTDDGNPKLSQSKTFSVVVRTPLEQPPPISELRFDPAEGFRFRIAVPERKQARLQVSTDLVTWADFNATPFTGTAQIQDRQSSAFAFRFYRLVVE